MVEYSATRCHAEMSLRDTFAMNLRGRRQALGLSQEELAGRAGLDRTYISALERSVYAATLDSIESLGQALDLDPADLLRHTAPPRRKRER